MTHGPYPAEAVANYFLEKAWEEGKGVDPLKIQKLVYFANGWHLGLYGSPLIDEEVRAWTYGPVITSLYHAFKKYGSGDIDSPVLDEGEDGEVRWPDIPEDDMRTRALLDRVWDVYKNYSGLRLSDMTHKPGTPWAQIHSPGSWNAVIPDKLLKTYFSKLAQEE